jgi:hypothetical protein
VFEGFFVFSSWFFVVIRLTKRQFSILINIKYFLKNDLHVHYAQSRVGSVPALWAVRERSSDYRTMVSGVVFELSR